MKTYKIILKIKIKADSKFEANEKLEKRLENLAFSRKAITIKEYQCKCRA